MAFSKSHCVACDLSSSKSPFVVISTLVIVITAVTAASAVAASGLTSILTI